MTGGFLFVWTKTINTFVLAASSASLQHCAKEKVLCTTYSEKEIPWRPRKARSHHTAKTLTLLSLAAYKRLARALRSLWSKIHVAGNCLVKSYVYTNISELVRA